MRPRWRHDCDRCIFLGGHGTYDLYVCPPNKTFIARAGSDGPDYQSGSPPFGDGSPLVAAVELWRGTCSACDRELEALDVAAGAVAAWNRLADTVADTDPADRLAIHVALKVAFDTANTAWRGTLAGHPCQKH